MAVASENGTFSIPGQKGNFRVVKGGTIPDHAEFVGAAEKAEADEKPAKGKGKGKPADAAATPGPTDTTQGTGPAEQV